MMRRGLWQLYLGVALIAFACSAQGEGPPMTGWTVAAALVLGLAVGYGAFFVQSRTRRHERREERREEKQP